jgi:hypothetical protein
MFFGVDTGTLSYTPPSSLPGIGILDAKAANLTFQVNASTTYPMIIASVRRLVAPRC